MGIDATFRVFADRTRLRILRLLGEGPLCVGDLVEILGAPQPTVSRHLTYLRRAGVVAASQHGLWRFYELAPAPDPLQRELLTWLAACDHQSFPEAKDDAERARRVRRSGGCCPEGSRLMAQSRGRKRR